MPRIPYKEGAEFPELPTKTPILTRIIESKFLADQENPFFGKETGRYDKNGDPIIDQKEYVNIVKVVFESVEDDTEGSRIWFKANASINERSKLRPLIEAAAFDHDPTKAELEEYDTDDLVDQYVYVSGSFGPKDEEHKFLRPESFMRYKEQFKPGFKRPGVRAAKAEDDGEDEDDEVKVLEAKLAAAKAAKNAKPEPKVETKAERLRRELAELEAAQEGAGTAEGVAKRRQSTREKAVDSAKKRAAKAEPEDPEAAF